MDRTGRSQRNRPSTTNSNVRSSGAKTATTHLKRTKGTFTKEAHRFKTGEDLDNLCARLETHFKKHGLDTIAHGNDPANTRNVVNISTSHPLFTVESMKRTNAFVITECGTHDKQNNDDAIECFVNSLGEDLRRRIRVKRKDCMLFSDTFMMFINIE